MVCDHAVSYRTGKDIADLQHNIVPEPSYWWLGVMVDTVHAQSLIRRTLIQIAVHDSANVTLSVSIREVAELALATSDDVVLVIDLAVGYWKLVIPKLTVQTLRQIVVFLASAAFSCY